MLRFDLVVVGAGPGGCLAALAAAAEGAKVLLVERAPLRQARCAGLVSMATKARLSLPEHLELRRILRARVFGPGGPVLELHAEEPKAVVLDRTGLDRWLRAKAQEHGVCLWHASVLAVEPGLLHCTKGPVAFEVLIGADGARSLVRKSLGFPAPMEELVGIQAVVDGELDDEVHVVLGPVPDFFGWAVPAEEGLVRVGLATAQGHAAPDRLHALLRAQFPGAKVHHVQTGLIPLGPPARTVGERALLVGNAAAQVKPLTGGGLAFLSLCAPMAGKIAAGGPGKLSCYERAWRDKVGKEISFQLQARRAFLRLGPAQIAEALKAMPPELTEFLGKEGDIDSFSLLPSKLRRRPDLWPALLDLSRWLAQAFLC